MTPGILFVFGTRPEAIKLCPLIRHLRRTGSFRTLVCTTGQHRELFTDALRVFDVTPDFDLAVMRSKQSLIGCASRILAGLEQVIRKTGKSKLRGMTFRIDFDRGPAPTQDGPG